MTGPVGTPVGDALTPTLLEIASGAVLGPASAGFDPAGDLGTVGDLGAVGPESSGVLGAIQQAILPLLTRTPCLVSFSGGMDSSFLLAVAVRAARRQGLALPVPVMWRFPPDATLADETARQEEVLAALGVAERIVLRSGDDLDLLGPIAADVRARFGARFPANLHLHAPIVAAAQGGSVLTGFGGDQVLGGHGSSARTLRGRLAGTLPPSARAGLHLRRATALVPWLRPGPRRAVGLRLAAHTAVRPAEPFSRIRFRCDDRATELAAGSLRELAAAQRVLIGHPFLHPGVQRQVAAAALRTPLPRAELLREIAGDAFPGVITERHPKARLHQVFLRSSTRQFRTGLTEAVLAGAAGGELVDPIALRAFWVREPLSTRSALLEQWLAGGAATGPSAP